VSPGETDVCGGQDASGYGKAYVGVECPMSLKRLFFSCCLCVATLSGGAEAAADIDVSPQPVKTGTTITFSAGPEGPAYSWDLDGDGVLGDKTGSPVTWGYATPGPVNVTVETPDGRQAKPIQVLGPSAAFVSFPAAPMTGQQMTFVYSSVEATDAIEWDLNGDGVFGDARGPIATTVFGAPGAYPVSLRVTDIEDPPAVSSSTQLIIVTAPPPPVRAGAVAPRLMAPFPIVRITGKVSRKGAQIKRLSVRAPKGATVSVLCRGSGCPFKRSSWKLALAGAKTTSRTIRITNIEGHLLRGGATVKVLISRQGEIGKYTRFKIRRGKPPLRTDLCLSPDAKASVACPVS
jgi:hypothetical protein